MRTRTRQLLNGMWVGEVKHWWQFRWRAVWNRFTELPGSTYYVECFQPNEDAAYRALVNFKSRRYGR